MSDTEEEKTWGQSIVEKLEIFLATRGHPDHPKEAEELAKELDDAINFAIETANPMA